MVSLSDNIQQHKPHSDLSYDKHPENISLKKSPSVCTPLHDQAILLPLSKPYLQQSDSDIRWILNITNKLCYSINKSVVQHLSPARRQCSMLTLLGNVEGWCQVMVIPPLMSEASLVQFSQQETLMPVRIQHQECLSVARYSYTCSIYRCQCSLRT